MPATSAPLRCPWSQRHPKGVDSDGMGVGGGMEEQSDSSRLLETESDKQNGGGREAGSRKNSPGRTGSSEGGRGALLALMLGREKTNSEQHRRKVLEATAQL